MFAPHLGNAKPVSGAPKRFAQGMGLVMTSAATALLALGYSLMTQILLGVLMVAAGLESIAGYCLGCTIFGVGIRLGIVPESVCAECADVRGRVRQRANRPLAAAHPS